jgi:hypothetical protein
MNDDPSADLDDLAAFDGLPVERLNDDGTATRLTWRELERERGGHDEDAGPVEARGRLGRFSFRSRRKLRPLWDGPVPDRRTRKS